MRRKVAIFSALLMGLFLGQSTYAQGKPMKVRVADMFGPATYSVKGSVSKPLSVGTVLPHGAVVKTGAGAALDLHFDTGEMVRMTQNTVLELDRAIVFRKAPYVELSLLQGTILGRVKNILPTQARFDVKVGNGVVSVRHGNFRVNQEGFLVLLQGHMFFAFVPHEGEPALHTLKAPPPVYFSPLEGVRPAPPPLVNEVQNQLRARLSRP